MSGHAASPTALMDDTRQLRLHLKPSGETTGHVDGAWWPRSDDLEAEAPRLLADLARDGGRPVRLSYDLADWQKSSTRTHLGPFTVHLDGFAGRRPHQVHVTDVDDHVLTLLVVPPESDRATATRALHHAALPGNLETPEALLEPAAGPARAEQRWESEGGSAG